MPVYTPYVQEELPTFKISPLLPLILSSNTLILSDADFSQVESDANNNLVIYNNMAVISIRQSYFIQNKSGTSELQTCLIDTNIGTFRVIGSYASVKDVLFVSP